MTQHAGGGQSEFHQPLHCVRSRHSSLAKRMAVIVLKPHRRTLSVVAAIVLSLMTTVGNAQSSRNDDERNLRSGSNLVLPRRPGESRLKDLPPNRTQSSRIRQTSSTDEPESADPPTPFHLDESLVDVQIEGNTTIPDSEIARHIKTRPDRPVTQKQIKDDVDELVRLRWFINVTPKLTKTEKGLVLVFSVIERPIVRRVEYKGLNKIKQKEFDSLTQLKPGSPFDISANRECARRIEEYYHEKGFAFATVELEKGNDRDDREVVFLINEGPKVHVTGVKFDGNKEFIDGILKMKTRTKTRILWLFGGKYDPTTIKDDIEGVKKYYHDLGYFDVSIDHRLDFSEDRSKVEIHYLIEEGIRSKIRNIEIVGNDVMSEADIREMIKLESGAYFNATDINRDVETIRAKYGQQGRLFCFVDATPRWTEEDGVVDLEFNIKEDKVYRVRNINVHIQGDHPHTKTNLVRNISTIQPGDLADPRQIHLFKRRLEGSQNFESGQQGGVRIETNVVRDDSWVNKNGAEVVRSQTSESRKKKPVKPPEDHPSRQREKPRSSVGSDSPLGRETSQSTLLRPNLDSREPGGVARRGGFFGLHGWIGTKESHEESRNPFVSVVGHFDQIAPKLSDPFAERKPAEDDGLTPITPVFRAQSKDPLKPPANFGYDVSPQGDPFGKAINDPDPDDWERLPPPEFVDLDAFVSEARTGRLMFGVGVNSNAGLVGNIVLSEQNFDISRPPTSWADIYNGTAWRGGGQKFKIEAMPGTQVSRYLVDWQDPYFMDTNFNLGVSGFYFLRYYRNWYEERVGGRVRVGRQLTQRWQAAVTLRLEDVDIYNAPTISPPILQQALGTSLLSTVRGSLIHDTRDAAFNASEGHYIEVSYEQGFGQYNYPRIEAEARQYFTTYRRVDGQGRHTVMLNGQLGWSGSQTPIFERFFAGGFQSFRGFAFRGVSPVQDGVYVGGDFMMLGTAEYQMPVTANEMIKIVGFTDVGTINDTVSLQNFRVSVGAGFRVAIPMMGPVPIALDFAVPIVHQDTDIQQVFSFYVGMNR